MIEVWQSFWTKERGISQRRYPQKKVNQSQKKSQHFLKAIKKKGRRGVIVMCDYMILVYISYTYVWIYKSSI